MTFPCKLGGEKSAVAVGSQSCAASLSIRHRRLRGSSTEHCQLREFCVEIDDAGRSTFPLPDIVAHLIISTPRRQSRSTQWICSSTSMSMTCRREG
jgi:hypothetical protein